MKSVPSISIALPVYNGAGFLRQALDSIESQTFTDFELIISDNASTDETPEICLKYARQDPRIKVNRSEQFLQQAENVNRAVDLCSGEWIKLLCHDDLMVPDCVARIWETAAASSSSLGLIGNGEQWLFANDYRYPSEGEHSAPKVWNGRTLIQRSLRGESTPPLPSLTTATVRKTAWQSSKKFDPRFAHFDVFFWMNLLMGWDYTYVPQILTVNRIHGAQVAVSARRTMRSIEDHKLYWREFIQQFGDSLELSTMDKYMTRLRPLGAAGSAVAVSILRGNTGEAFTIFSKTPVSWWPFLPAFAMRSYRREKRKIELLMHHVPIQQLYP